MRLQRRELLQSGAGVMLLRGLAAVGLAGISGLSHAKPGGHAAAAHYCSATFDVREFGVINLFLCGTGYASFHNVRDYARFDVREVLNSETVSMEWEVNRCYSASSIIPPRPAVRANALVRGKSDRRSQAFLLSKQPGVLFPATMLNGLYFEVTVPDRNLTMVNKDPILLRGEVRPMDREAIMRDPRVINNPAGLPKSLTSPGPYFFEPQGVHTLVKPVEFFDTRDPNKLAATLIASRVETVPNYGLEVELVDSAVRRDVVTGTFKITNLTGKRQDINWYVEDSRDLRLLGGVREGRHLLKDTPLVIPFQAYNANPALALGKESCLFCGAVKASDSLDDLVTGFAYTDGSHYRQVAE